MRSITTMRPAHKSKAPLTTSHGRPSKHVSRQLVRGDTELDDLQKRVKQFQLGIDTTPIKVRSAGWSSSEWSMGDLERLGYMTKERLYDQYETIVWTLKADSGIVIQNSYREMKPGDEERWEK